MTLFSLHGDSVLDILLGPRLVPVQVCVHQNHATGTCRVSQSIETVPLSTAESQRCEMCQPNTQNRTKTTGHHTFCRMEVQAELFTTRIGSAPSVSYEALSFVVFVEFVDTEVASQSGSWHQFKGKAKRVSPLPIFTPVPSAVTRLFTVLITA